MGVTPTKLPSIRTEAPEGLLVTYSRPRVDTSLSLSFAGLRGATVIDSRGMGSILGNEVPIFAGFRTLFPGGGAGTYAILSVVSEEQVDDAISMADEVCGDLDRPGTGFIFTVPVGRMKGLAEDLR